MNIKSASNRLYTFPYYSSTYEQMKETFAENDDFVLETQFNDEYLEEIKNIKHEHYLSNNAIKIIDFFDINYIILNYDIIIFDKDITIPSIIELIDIIKECKYIIKNYDIYPFNRKHRIFEELKNLSLVKNYFRENIKYVDFDFIYGSCIKNTNDICSLGYSGCSNADFDGVEMNYYNIALFPSFSRPPLICGPKKYIVYSVFKEVCKNKEMFNLPKKVKTHYITNKYSRNDKYDIKKYQKFNSKSKNQIKAESKLYC